MASKRLAFPVLDALNPSCTHLCEITRAPLMQVFDIITARAQAPSLARLAPASLDAVHCALRVGGSITVPFTVVGAVVGQEADGNVLVHFSGLSGALPIALTELQRCRGVLSVESEGVYSATPGATTEDDGNDDRDAAQLGSLCALEVVSRDVHQHRTLDAIYCNARRRHRAVVGLEKMMVAGSRLNVRALRCDFPYHCGGAQAERRYVDARDDVCAVFGPHFTHGTKVLSRCGVAVSVGVAEEASVGTPGLLWHPSGAPAACLAPMLHGSATVPVGVVALDYNGPTAASELLTEEDPRRYLNCTVDGEYDKSTWLCGGLFGVQPGQPMATPDGRSCVVCGVGFDTEEKELELYLRDVKSGEVVAADVL